MPDVMEIEILEDGQIKFTTDKISATNHANADEFLAEVEALAGGERVTEKKKSRFSKSHAHNHVHAH